MAKLLKRVKLETQDDKRRINTDIIEIDGVKVRVHRLVPEKLDLQAEEAQGIAQNSDDSKVAETVGKNLDSAADELSDTEAEDSKAGSKLISKENPITFVLVHGIGVSTRYFVPLAEELVQYGQVILIDLPGFSGLPAPKDKLTIKEFAQVVREVVKLEKIERPVYIGHSMGSQVVTEAVASIRDNSPMLLIGPPINVKERSVSMAVMRFLQASIHEGPNLSALAIWAYLRCGFSWFFRIVPTMMAYPIEERIKRFSGPLTIMRGQYDQIAPMDWLALLADASQSPDPELVEVAGAAHSVVYEYPQEIAKAAVKLAHTWEK